MPTEVITIIIGSLAGLLTSGITGFLAYKQTLKRLEVEKQEPLARATKIQIENLLATVERLEKEVADVRGELTYQKSRTTKLATIVRNLNNGSLKLVGQLESMGIEPVWIPPQNLDLGV